MKKNRAELVATFIIGYVTLLVICLVIYFIFSKTVGLNIFGKTADQSTILTNLFIWSATLYAPIVAIFLFDNWKVQEKYKQNVEMLSKSFLSISKSNKEILEINESIDDIYQSYLSYKNFILSRKLINQEILLDDKNIISFEENISMYIRLNKTNLNDDLIKNYISKFNYIKLYQHSIQKNYNEKIVKILNKKEDQIIYDTEVTYIRINPEDEIPNELKEPMIELQKLDEAMDLIIYTIEYDEENKQIRNYKKLIIELKEDYKSITSIIENELNI